MKNKKGIGPIIATLLIIVLTITVSGIVAQFVVPFVKDMLKGTDCLNYRDYFSLDGSLGYNCYNQENIYAITVRANKNSESLNKDLIGFDLFFLKEGSAIKKSIRMNDKGSCKKDGISILDEACNSALEIPGKNNYAIITYRYNSSIEKYSKVEIYPVLKGGEVCEKTDTTRLVLCNPPNKLD